MSDQALSQTTVGAFVWQLLRLSRPSQWWKNGFVLVGLVFGHAWQAPDLLTNALLALLACCLASSCVYVLNDLVDVNADRLHPKKCNRPIASGALSETHAALYGLFLAASSMALAISVSSTVVGLILIYAGLNVAYSALLKHIVIVDAFVIAAGFMIRVLVGSWGIGIAPSQWLLLCTTMLTLFLAFAKRRAEAANGLTRSVLSHYPLPLLDSLINITAACTILSYALYTMNAATIQLHHTTQLIWTVPIVSYGIFRYLYLLHLGQAGEDPSVELLKDPHIRATVVAWGLFSAFLIR